MASVSFATSYEQVRRDQSGCPDALDWAETGEGRAGGVRKLLKRQDRIFFSNSVNGFWRVVRNGDRALRTEPAGGRRISCLF